MSRARHSATASRVLVAALVACGGGAGGATVGAFHQDGGVRLECDDDTITAFVDGVPLFVYHYNTVDPQVPRPYFHPLYSPDGEVITQMGEVPGERVAHFHHTGLYIAHQNFSDGNNWQMDADPANPSGQFSRILHREFTEITGGDEGAWFVERLEWDNRSGDAILVRETRRISVPHPSTLGQSAGQQAGSAPELRAIDIELTLEAVDREITLNPTPYHIVACRVLDAMLPVSGGAITNSEGDVNPEDGTAAHWIDISGPLARDGGEGGVGAEGGTVGVAIFNHPDNYRDPTPCLNFANQTIGAAPAYHEAYTLRPGEPLRLRYRVLIHDGDAEHAGVAGHYAAYAEE